MGVSRYGWGVVFLVSIEDLGRREKGKEDERSRGASGKEATEYRKAGRC